LKTRPTHHHPLKQNTPKKHLLKQDRPQSVSPEECTSKTRPNHLPKPLPRKLLKHRILLRPPPLKEEWPGYVFKKCAKQNAGRHTPVHNFQFSFSY